MCLSCGIKTTIDLCDKESCFTSEVGLDVRDDLTTPHLPSHDVFKIRRAIHPFRELGEVCQTAQDALKRVRGLLSGLKESDQRGQGSAESQWPRCVNCRGRVSSPCWFCIECKGKPRRTSNVQHTSELCPQNPLSCVLRATPSMKG